MKKNYCAILFAMLATYSVAQTEHKLLGSDGSAGDIFGRSVDISGDFAVVGSPQDDDNGAESGAAYVYHFDGTSWNQQQKLVPASVFPGDQFGTSVAIYDSVIVVGSRYDDDLGTDCGSAYVFRYDGATWVEETQLFPSDGAAGDEFGFAVDINLNNIIVGAYRHDAVATDAGAAYVFYYSGTWTEADKLTAFDGTIDDFYGYSVAISGPVAVVGAYLDDDMGVNSGGVYVYRTTGPSWPFEEKLVPANGGGGDAFGFDVAIDNNLIVVGAYAKDNVSTDDGSVYLYRYSGSWNIEDELTASDAGMDDWFGYTVAVSGKLVTVGVFHSDDLGFESGAYYLYGYDDVIWIEEIKVLASDGEFADQFGEAVGMDGYRIISGAINDDDRGMNAGAAYVYDICTYRPVQEICVATVDSVSGKNLVIWQEPLTSLTDSFHVYRNTTNLLASYAYGVTESHLDMTSTPWNNPEDYQVTSRNECQAESMQGVPHVTMYLEATPGAGVVDLNWTSASGFSFPYYNVWRDSLGNGDWELIWATLAAQTNYTDNNPPGTASLRYMIEVPRGFSCDPQWNATISNVSNPNTVGIEQTTEPSLSIAPNPSAGLVTITLDRMGEMLIQVHTIDGRMVMSRNNLVNGPLQLDLSALDSGVYLVTISGASYDWLSTSRIVLE